MYISVAPYTSGPRTHNRQGRPACSASLEHPGQPPRRAQSRTATLPPSLSRSRHSGYAYQITIYLHPSSLIPRSSTPFTRHPRRRVSVVVFVLARVARFCCTSSVDCPRTSKLSLSCNRSTRSFLHTLPRPSLGYIQLLWHESHTNSVLSIATQPDLRSAACDLQPTPIEFQWVFCAAIPVARVVRGGHLATSPLRRTCAVGFGSHGGGQVRVPDSKRLLRP